jgi:putative transposase
MTRTIRLVQPHFPHHIILRGNNRRRLFSCANDFGFFLRCLHRAVSEREVRIHGIALMTNHIHLVATPESGNEMSRFVQRVSQRYAQYRNKKRESTGKLFEQRYHSFPIYTERQLAVVTAYDDLNPVRAALVDDPAQFAWSTAAIHLGRASFKIPTAIWSPSHWYEHLGHSPAERAARYAEWIKGVRERQESPEKLRVIDAAYRLTSERYPHRLERPNRKRAA